MLKGADCIDVHRFKSCTWSLRIVDRYCIGAVHDRMASSCDCLMSGCMVPYCHAYLTMENGSFI